jgi:hypothetical protein
MRQSAATAQQRPSSSDDGAEALAQLLEEHSSLTSLSLAWCKLRASSAVRPPICALQPHLHDAGHACMHVEI